MKKKFKFTLFLTSISLLLGITSCKKDWTCECSYDGSGFEDVETYPNTKKADAKKVCDAYETILLTEYSDAKCRLK